MHLQPLRLARRLQLAMVPPAVARHSNWMPLLMLRLLLLRRCRGFSQVCRGDCWGAQGEGQEEEGEVKLPPPLLPSGLSLGFLVILAASSREVPPQASGAHTQSAEQAPPETAAGASAKLLAKFGIQTRLIHLALPTESSYPAPTVDNMSYAALCAFAKLIRCGGPSNFKQVEAARKELQKRLSKNGHEALQFALYAQDLLLGDLRFLHSQASCHGAMTILKLKKALPTYAVVQYPCVFHNAGETLIRELAYRIFNLGTEQLGWARAHEIEAVMHVVPARLPSIPQSWHVPECLEFNLSELAMGKSPRPWCKNNAILEYMQNNAVTKRGTRSSWESGVMQHLSGECLSQLVAHLESHAPTSANADA